MAARLLWPRSRRLGRSVQRLSVQSVVVVCKAWGAWCNAEPTAGHFAVLKSGAVAFVLNTTARAVVVIAVSVSAGLLMDSGRSARSARGGGSSEV